MVEAGGFADAAGAGGGDLSDMGVKDSLEVARFDALQEPKGPPQERKLLLKSKA